MNNLFWISVESWKIFGSIMGIFFLFCSIVIKIKEIVTGKDWMV